MTRYKNSTGTGANRRAICHAGPFLPDPAREALSAAFDTASISEGPGGGASIVPGTGHTLMNMYVAQSKGGKWEIISKGEQISPDECT